MNKTSLMKIIIWLIIGIILYFVMEALIGEEVSANIEAQGKENDELFPFYWLLIIVGGIIASTLSYVSWRKYKGEKNEQHSKSNNKSID
ncbi:sporulation protein YpjB [Paucisalibacillus globulus]|jgi:heme/copper-type cytochrome/quinol oxidase subunit 2|uniref:sporulation protein YpjB n=1 Tax=Paucisalibacillus globulus TaxID=351095 RepID=UPI000BB86038|nr:sporulation protein YpjB [Paucisalibacillus globulus]